MFSSKLYSALVVFGTMSLIAANTVDNDCPLICPLLYSPICASDGKIFKEFVNDCEMKDSNCQLNRNAMQTFSLVDMAWCTSERVDNLREKLGELDLSIAECLKPCPMIYAPVCVTNEKYRGNISSKCELDMYNCVLERSGATKFLRLLQESPC